ncbi:MAG: crossover junction endodeoxyribonuclease RuvC [Sphaerochaeta sp.]|jgi:Holliday junction resolvasome RuvABC endonuclease subunit|nr:crossover junction endodeoxyribonuclease RuvC [Sphaerochaeta sp.]
MGNRFVALDPSSLNVGWAVFQGDGLVAWGNISAGKIDFDRRFMFLTEQLSIVARQYNPQEIAAEETKFRWKGREIASLRVAYLSIRKWAERSKIPWTQYNVATWKASVLGDNHAGKEQTEATIRMIYPRLPAGLSEHEIDAIAVGIYHAGVRRLETMAGGPITSEKKKRGKK